VTRSIRVAIVMTDLQREQRAAVEALASYSPVPDDPAFVIQGVEQYGEAHFSP